MKKAVYPGSFDPITQGHIDIIERLTHIFDHITVLVAQSSQKTSTFTAPERKALIEKALGSIQGVHVEIFEGLTTDYMARNQAHVIVRGLRAVSDFEYEMTMACMNKKLAPNIETMLVFARPEFYYISSRGVKEIAQNGGDLNGLIPSAVINDVKNRFKK